MEEIFYIILAIVVIAVVILLPVVSLIVALVALSRVKRLSRQIEQGEAQSLPAEAVEPGLVPAESVAEPIVPCRRKAIQWELLIGQKALGWVAVVLMVFAAAFFLRYAYENQWIGPLGRVIIGALGGLAMVTAGWHYSRRGWRVFSQMLTAGGLVVLYLITYAAFGFYHLAPQYAASVFMVILVAESMILAVRYNSPAIALTAVLGGLLVPLLMHSEHDRYIELFAYLAALDLGVVLLVLLRPWRAIATIALLGTQGLFWIWYFGNYHPEKQAWAIGFQAVVYIFFLAHGLGAHWLRGWRVTWEDAARLLMGAAFWFTAVYVLLQNDCRPWMGSAAIGMALVYAIIARGIFAVRPSESRLVLTSLAISVGFVALSFPLEAEAAWIALGWMAVGGLLWWFGLRVETPALRVIGAILAGMAVVRVLGDDWPHSSRGEFIPVFNEFAVPAIGIAACLLGALVAGQRFTQRLDRAEQVLAAAAGLTGISLLLMILSADCHGYFAFRALESATHRAAWFRAGQMSLSILWAIYATGLLAVGFRTHVARLRWAAIGLFALTVGKVFFVDMSELNEIYRILAFFVLALFVGAAAWAYQRIEPRSEAADSR